MRETQTQDRQDTVVDQMDNAALEFKSAQLRIMKKALIDPELEYQDKFFYFGYV